MSRFVNPAATKRFELGPCECPGTPHGEGDWMALRSELGAQDLIAMEEGGPFERMVLLIKDWNLIGDDGKVAPISEEYVSRLYLDLFPTIDAWLTENARTESLPKASDGPSRSSSAAKRSRIRTVPKVA